MRTRRTIDLIVPGVFLSLGARVDMSPERTIELSSCGEVAGWALRSAGFESVDFLTPLDEMILKEEAAS